MNLYRSLKLNNSFNEDQIRRIDNSIQRINHQVEHVLDYVRETPLQISRFNLSKILENVIVELAIYSEIKINMSENIVLMLGDEKKIEVVLTNLILNSIQSVENKGKIDITLSETDIEVIIEVTDSGLGITIKPIEKVFDLLVSTKQKGTGHGLASCKNVIEQHGGTISVKNNPTTFTIKIPKKPK